MDEVIIDKVNALRKRYVQLEQEREHDEPTWRRLLKYLDPYAGQFDDWSPTQQRGDQMRHLYDDAHLRSVRTLEAGLLTGASSPARPWFRLETPDTRLNERQPVREWLHQCEVMMRQVFGASNTYRTLRTMYGHLGKVGTAADVLLPNFDRIIHHFPQPPGAYYLGADDLGIVDTMYRSIWMTIDQIVKKFGYENCSFEVQNSYSRGQLSEWREVIHAIEPRRDRNPLKLDSQNMPFTSIYFEAADTRHQRKLLREGGYQEFRVIAPRWSVQPSRVYGQGPGHQAINTVITIQRAHMRYAQGLDYMVQPPLMLPGSTAVRLHPGAINRGDVDARGGALWDTNVNLQPFDAYIKERQLAVSRAFFEDLFILFVNDDRAQARTAREVAERHEEKLLMLGPVLESVHDECLTPLIEITFADLLRAGVLPPTPRELEGQELRVRFVSLLAQAQQLVGLNSIDRLLGTVSSLAAVQPSVLDKVDFDAAVDEYSQILGVPPDLIVGGEKVALIRAQRQQQMQAQQMAEQAPNVTRAGRDISEMDDTTANATVQALRSLGGP